MLSVLAFDFFFVPPVSSASPSPICSHIVTFAVMFLVAVVISGLTKRIRDQADSARGRERRTASLYAMSRELGAATARPALLQAAARHVTEVFDVKVAVLLPGPGDELEIVHADEGTLAPGDKDLGVAEWVWNHQRAAGAGTDTLPAGDAPSSSRSSGRAAASASSRCSRRPSRASTTRTSGSSCDTIAGLIGSALERTQLADEARRASLRIETEQLRNALLSSVSHDLRTPLGVVTGATSALLEDDVPKDDATRRELLETAHDEALRLNRLVRNLLDMTRLEAGALKVQKELQPLEEVVGSALDRMEDRLRGREVKTSIPADLPLVPFDAILDRAGAHQLARERDEVHAGRQPDRDRRARARGRGRGRGRRSRARGSRGRTPSASSTSSTARARARAGASVWA